MLPLRACLEAMESKRQADSLEARNERISRNFIRLRDALLKGVDLRSLKPSSTAEVVKQFMSAKKGNTWRNLYLESEEFEKSETIVLLKVCTDTFHDTQIARNA